MIILLNTFFNNLLKYFHFILPLIFSTTLITCYTIDNNSQNLTNNRSTNAQGKNLTSHNFKLSLANSSIDNKQIASVLINIESIEINSEDEGWYTIIDYGEKGKIVDVLLYENELTATLGYLNLKPGIYNQIRIHLKNENLIMISNDNKYSLLPLKIPSSSRTGLKIVKSFEVKEDGITSITVDFDAQRSIHYSRGQGYILRPTIKIKSVETTEEVILEIPTDRGGNISILNEIDVTIPRGSFPSNTEITFKKIETPYIMPFSSTYILSDYYDFNPKDLLSNHDISIILNYLDIDISNKNISEENLKIYSIQNDNGEWQKLDGSVDMDSNQVSASTNQLATFALGGPPAEAPWIDPAQIIKATDGIQSCQVPLKVKALINDADGIEKATLSYKEAGTLAFYTVEMTNVGNNWYEGEIPLNYLKDQLSSTAIEVFIEAIDNSGKVSFAPVTSALIPHLYEYNPDMDNDSINDRWEIEMGLDITVDDSQLDPDNDGYTNLEEYSNNTDPYVPEFIPGPEDIESLCVVNKESHYWNSSNWDFAMIDTNNQVIPLASADQLDIEYDIDISRFYVVKTDYIRYSYKTRNTAGLVGPVNYSDPETDVRIYDDFEEIDSFYEEFERPGYTETWTPLPIYIQFHINYSVTASNSNGSSYSEAFYLFYQD